MAYALTLIGLMMIVTGVQNTHAQFGAQLKKDFTGQNNFIVWMLAIGAVGALGYVKNLRTFSHYFLALILISIVLSNQKQGLIAKFNDAIKSGPVDPTAGAASAAGNPFSGLISDAVAAGIKSAAGVSSSGQITMPTGTTNVPGSPATGLSNWLTGKLGLPSWIPLN